MQVTEMKADEIMSQNIPLSKPTDEELQREYDFYIAEKLNKLMQESGMISLEESTRLSAENRKYFSPFLAELSCV